MSKTIARTLVVVSLLTIVNACSGVRADKSTAGSEPKSDAPEPATQGSDLRKNEDIVKEDNLQPSDCKSVRAHNAALERDINEVYNGLRVGCTEDADCIPSDNSAAFVCPRVRGYSGLYTRQKEGDLASAEIRIKELQAQFQNVAACTEIDGGCMEIMGDKSQVVARCESYQASSLKACVFKIKE